MELYISAGQNDRDPYWCEPWPSALAMSAELLQRPQLVAGKRVCELGCGLGLAGLAAAAAGAAEVVLLDREPLALQCALLNAALNGLPTADPSAAAAAAVAAAEADGGGSGAGVQPPTLEDLLPHLQPADAQLLADWQAQQAKQAAQQRETPAEASSSSSSSSSTTTTTTTTTTTSETGSGSRDTGSSNSSTQRETLRPGLVRVEVFDWSQPVTLAPHDVMLVCDCLYESFSVEPVAAVAPKLLSRRGDARLLLADPPDRARHNRECFLDILCEESGEFLLEESTETSVPTWEASKGAWRDTPVMLMHLRRGGGGGGDTVGVKLRRQRG
ncbi:hypothetical protein ABPG75_003325 [Micractinium tetrahymenae]